MCLSVPGGSDDVGAARRPAHTSAGGGEAERLSATGRHPGRGCRRRRRAAWTLPLPVRVYAAQLDARCERRVLTCSARPPSCPSRSCPPGASIPRPSSPTTKSSAAVDGEARLCFCSVHAEAPSWIMRRVGRWNTDRVSRVRTTCLACEGSVDASRHRPRTYLGQRGGRQRAYLGPEKHGACQRAQRTRDDLPGSRIRGRSKAGGAVWRTGREGEDGRDGPMLSGEHISAFL